MTREITLETGELPICVDCQTKHAVDLKAHVDPKTPRYEAISKIVEGLRKEIMISPEQLKEYENIREIEHKLEDYSAVLRDMRHGLQEESCSTCSVSNPGSNPGPDDDELLEIRIPMAVGLSPEETEKYIEDMTKLYERVKKIREKQKKGNPTICPAGMEKTDHYCAETVAPMKEFDPKSIRTVVRDEHRVVIGCPKGKYDRAAQRCKVGTRAHKILRPTGE